MTPPESQQRRASGRHWLFGALCGGLVGFGHALNIIAVYKDGPASNMPGVMGASAAFIGIAAFVFMLIESGLTGPANPFQGGYAVIGLLVLTVVGTVVGLIGWPVLKRMQRK